jgi:hypothetical protein
MVVSFNDLKPGDAFIFANQLGSDERLVFLKLAPENLSRHPGAVSLVDGRVVYPLAFERLIKVKAECQYSLPTE